MADPQKALNIGEFGSSGAGLMVAAAIFWINRYWMLPCRNAHGALTGMVFKTSASMRVFYAVFSWFGCRSLGIW